MSDILHPSLEMPRLSPYPDFRRSRESATDRFGTAVAGQLICRASAIRAWRLSKIVSATQRHEETMRELSNEALKQRFLDLGRALRKAGQFEVNSVGPCFAVIREASRRTLGMRHHDVQLIGGYTMLQGMIAEMDTGEGKSLTATLTAATACLAGFPTHVVTVNDYLAQRDSEDFEPLYTFLGLRVGCALQEDEPEQRKVAYGNDVTYCTNKVLTFDYLRDQIELNRAPNSVQLRLERLYGENSVAPRLLLRGLHFAIVDEADSVLVDEARTPLLISQEVPSQFSKAELEQALTTARSLEATKGFRISSDERRIQLTHAGEEQIREQTAAWGGKWKIPSWRNELINKALSADWLFNRGEHYLVQDEAVVIVDEFTGRVMPDRFWSEALHQLIELKEDCDLSNSRETLARISYQKFFRRYRNLAGMTGTAREIDQELWRVYRLPLAKIPTHKPRISVDQGETVFDSSDEKWRHVARRCQEIIKTGRPVLIGTRTVAASVEASTQLHEAGLQHTVLNADQDSEEAAVIAEAGSPSRITIATNMAGRGADISITPEVATAGGLHVILTERHDAARIDRQLQGRTGRHGAPGSFESVLSLEDAILGMDSSRWPKQFAAQLGPRGPKSTQSKISQWRLRRAQKRAELLHQRMRRQVLRADEELDDLMAFSGRSD